MNRSTWKRRELDVAKRLKGVRKPVSGREAHEPDVETPLLVIQAKHGRNRPSYLKDWLHHGICGVAKDRGKLGVVVWSSMREDVDDAVVLMRLRDFEDLYGPLVAE